MVGTHTTAPRLRIPEPRARVNKDAAGRNICKRTNCVNKVFAPRCNVLGRVQGCIRRRNLDVENHDFTVAERANSVHKVLGLSSGVDRRMAKVIGPSEIE